MLGRCDDCSELISTFWLSIHFNELARGISRVQHEALVETATGLNGGDFPRSWIRTCVPAEEPLSAEVREIQKAAAVLACIQCATEYENDDGADLADAVAVVRAMLTTVAARIVTGSPKEGKVDA